MYDYCTIIFNPGRWFQLPWKKHEKKRSSLGIIIHFYGWKLKTKKSLKPPTKYATFTLQ